MTGNGFTKCFQAFPKILACREYESGLVPKQQLTLHHWFLFQLNESREMHEAIIAYHPPQILMIMSEHFITLFSCTCFHLLRGFLTYVQGLARKVSGEKFTLNSVRAELFK